MSCPNKRKHTKTPSGYNSWHEWARNKERRHKCTQCPDCGLWVIWRLRGPDEEDYGGRLDEFEGMKVEKIAES